jgi:hypothetical protein
LQNGVTKICTEGMTFRLQPFVSLLVHCDQTGFGKGRCIAQNFLYMAEIVHCCHKRHVATIALKLYFTKAFESIHWGAMDAILRAKGSPDAWCQWISALNTSSTTTNVLNGVSGR